MISDHADDKQRLNSAHELMDVITTIVLLMYALVDHTDVYVRIVEYTGVTLQYN